MRRRRSALAAALGAMAIVALVPAAAGGRTTMMIEAQSMTGVPAALTVAQAPIRGVNGGGVPWVVGSAKLELSTGGSLELKVRHLVIDPNDPVAISRGIGGTNPIPNFRVLVSCLTSSGATMNVSSDLFPVTTGLGGGSGEIETQLALPMPCIAPIVFITSPGGAWFATTGG